MQTGSPIYLVRHGETEWNSAGRYQGAKNSPLTTRGRSQAQAYGTTLTLELAEQSLPVLTYVSPLGRAQETAAIIANSVPLDIRIEPRIAEISTGTWDGMSLYEIEMEHPDALTGSSPYDWYFRAPDGESFDNAITRVRSWLEDVKRPCLAVTHGLASRLIRGVYEGLSEDAMLTLDVPQNGFYRLNEGQSTFLECAGG